MRDTIRRYSRQGMPIYGECGGFMYLCRELMGATGQTHPMCDCFPFGARMHPKLRTLGYREVQLNTDTPMGPKGAMLRGHEFHYSDLTAIDDAPSVQIAYTVSARKGGSPQQEGYLMNRTLGSYIHLHFGSRPESAAAFVDTCIMAQQQRRSTHETPGN